MRIRRLAGSLAVALVLAASAGPAHAEDIPQLSAEASCWWQVGESPRLSLNLPLTVVVAATNADPANSYSPTVNQLSWTDPADTIEELGDPPETYEPDSVTDMVVTITPAKDTSLALGDAVVWRVGNADPAEHLMTVSQIAGTARCTEEPVPTSGTSPFVLGVAMLVPVVIAGVLWVLWGRRAQDEESTRLRSLARKRPGRPSRP